MEANAAWRLSAPHPSASLVLLAFECAACVQRRQPQLELVHHDRGQVAQGRQVGLGHLARHGVEDVDGAEPVAIGGDERRGGVELDAELPCDQRIAGDARVGAGVIDEYGSSLQDRRGAQPRVAADLAHAVQAVGGLEPDPVGVHDADGRDRRARTARRQGGHPVERPVGRRVEDARSGAPRRDGRARSPPWSSQLLLTGPRGQRLSRQPAGSQHIRTPTRCAPGAPLRRAATGAAAQRGRRRSTAVNCWLVPQGVWWSSPAGGDEFVSRELPRQLLVGVAHDRQPTAGQRAVRTEGGHHGVAAGPQAAPAGRRGSPRARPARSGSGRPRGRATARTCRPGLKSSTSATVRTTWSPCRAEPVAHRLECGLGEVDRHQVEVAALHEVVDEGRPAGADVDDRLGYGQPGLVDQAQGELRHRLPPRDTVLGLATVHVLPEGLACSWSSGRASGVL